MIVTAKWLTGFDAKNLGVMYLDKPLRAHTLFQAITRTNHTWTNPETGQEKTAGLVIDYIGLGAEIATGSVLSVRLPWRTGSPLVRVGRHPPRRSGDRRPSNALSGPARCVAPSSPPQRSWAPGA